MLYVPGAIVDHTDSTPIFSEMQVLHERRDGESTAEVRFRGDPVATFLFNRDTGEWGCGAQDGVVPLSERRLNELGRRLKEMYPNG